MKLRQPARTTSRTACLRCHEKVLSGITSSGGLKIKHSVCAPGATCDGCHSAVAHGTTVRWRSGSDMDECMKCHRANKGPLECNSCHGDRHVDNTNASTAWRVEHGPNWRKMHGLGDLTTCVTCHPGDYCATCHGVALPHPREFGTTHGGYAIENPGSCMVCHKSQTEFCDKCHTMEMPHPDGFISQHTKIAKGTADPRCIRCHDNGDCDKCHGYHVHPGGGAGVPVPWTITPESQRP